MKKNYYPPVFASALLFATAFLFSCQNPDNEKADHQALNDSLQLSLMEEEADLEPEDSAALAADSLIGPGADYIPSLASLHRRLRKKASQFTIKTNRDTVIRCRNGAILAIPANAFLSAADQSAVNGEVKISVREFYKLSDIFLAGLSTTSNHQLLETGGMIDIKVTSTEKKDTCVLKPGKSITIAIPNSDSTLLEGMQVFNGDHDSTGLNWVPQRGVTSAVQTIRFKRDDWTPIPPQNGFVFPDKLPKVAPHPRHPKESDFRAEIMLSLRDLMRHVGTVTEKARAYVDTSGTLHCYKVGGRSLTIRFPDLYTSSRSENIPVHVAVDAQISYRSHLNHDYYQKLFKMGKGNPDSLVAITVTLNPVLRMAPSERMKVDYENAITLKEYRRLEKYREQLMLAYEKKLEALRLNNEEELIRLQNSKSANLQTAQNYLLLSTPRLGWINCDRFYKAKEQVEYFVETKEKCHLMMVFNSLHAIMSPDPSGVFHGVPLNARVTLVALKTEKGELQMAVEETTVSRQPFNQLNFKPVTVKEYKSSLEKLNRL